jgi:hypothetical protein
MAFVYEVNGQRVEFEKEPTEQDIDEAARSLGTKPVSRQPKPVEGEGGAAFGMYPQAGRRPESQQNREAALDMPLQTIRGVASNVPAIAGIPGSIVNAVANAPQTSQRISNRIANVTSQLQGKGPLPEPEIPTQKVTPYDIEHFAQMVPGPQPNSPAGQLAFGAGQAVSAPLAGPAMNMVGQVAKAPVQFGKGFARGLAYPEGSSPNTALAPIRPTYVPHEQVSEFMAGQRPASSLTELPTAPLYENKPVANWAYGMAPENQAGQKLVPYAGRTMEGVGEQIGSQYRKNPITGLIDIGATLATGVPAPLTAMAKAVPAIAARQLQQATQFEPGFGPARAAALAREGQAGLQANMPPTQNLLPAPGPVNPTMIANQQGVVTGPQGTPLPTQASGQPVTQPNLPSPSTPKQASMQAAAARIQPVAPAPMPAPQIQPKPVQQPPTLPPGRNSSVIRNELDTLAKQSDELHQQGLESGIKYGTPEGESHQAQLGQLHARTKTLEKELEEALKAEKKANKPSKKGPSNVSQMLTEDQGKMWNALKAGESELEQKISKMTQENRDRLERNIRQSAKPGDPVIQEFLDLFEKYRIK